MPLMRGLNPSEPDRQFLVFTNGEGATINKDATVQVDVTTDADGVRAVDMNSGELFAFLGVADAAVADGEQGLVQVEGYRSTSQVFQTDTTQAAGLPLIPVAAQEYFQSVVSSTASNAAVTLQPVFAFLVESIATSSASATISAKIWIRAL
jgi:hypothetical protein